MRIALFAGGFGQRLWPMSTEKTPKQFSRIYNGKSTLDMCLDLFASEYGWDNIMINLPKKFVDLAHKEYPLINEKNLLGESIRRDLGPAVALASARLIADNLLDEPMGLMWTDDLIGNGQELLRVLKASEKIVRDGIRPFVYIGEEPRFANQNVGWIEKGESFDTIEGVDFLNIKSFKYRPDQETADKWFKAKTHLFHSAFHVTTARFVMDKYKVIAPSIYEIMMEIVELLKAGKNIDETYEKFEMANFDNSFLEKLSDTECCTATCDIGSIAIGTHVAYKDYYQKEKGGNVIEGNVVDLDSKNTLVVNRDPEMLVATIGLQDMIVVKDNNALIVCHDVDLPRIKELLEKVKSVEELKKYL